MNIKKFHIYLADLDPSFGTEPGKTRPVVVVQTDLLNDVHNSTVVCPFTTKLKDAYPIRVRIAKGRSGLPVDSDIMVDQVRTLDNRRFIRRLGVIPAEAQRILWAN